MKARRSNSRSAREGYVSLLAVTFAFCLATLGTAVAVSVRAYLAAAVGQEQSILDRIALETATTTILGQLSRAGAIAEVGPIDSVVVGRHLSISLSSPVQKIDVMDDPDDALVRDIAGAGLTGMPRLKQARLGGGMAVFSARLGLNATQEDCLRRTMTYGRSPASRDTAALTDGQALSVGDQVDLRAEIIQGDVRAVLWTRARFTGNEASPWQVHDYRFLITTSANCDATG